MNHRLIIIVVITTQILSACATAPRYQPPPSLKDDRSHVRQQLPQPSTLQKTGAFVSGVIGGALGPLGIIVTKLGSKLTTEVAMNHFWRKFSNAEIFGVVIEDVTERRKEEISEHKKSFTNLPDLNKFPKHYSIDLGAGHMMILPMEGDIALKTGDLVRVITAENVSKLQTSPIDYSLMPMITDKICDADNKVCLNDPNNEIGVVGYVAI